MGVVLRMITLFFRRHVFKKFVARQSLFVVALLATSSLIALGRVAKGTHTLALGRSARISFLPLSGNELRLFERGHEHIEFGKSVRKIERRVNRLFLIHNAMQQTRKDG